MLHNPHKLSLTLFRTTTEDNVHVMLMKLVNASPGAEQFLEQRMAHIALGAV
jgi:hypothetical protein